MYKRGGGGYKIPAAWGLRIYTPPPSPGKSLLARNGGGGGAYVIPPWKSKEGISAINLSNLGKFGPNLAPGHLFMLGRLAVRKIIYVRPVGSPENTSKIGKS